MAAEPDEADELQLSEDDILDEDQDTQKDPGGEDPEDEEQEVYFGDEPPEPEAGANSGLVKHLREQIKERDRRLAARPAQEPVEVGEYPELADYEYDEEKHKAAVQKWALASTKAESAESEQQRREREANEGFQADLQRYEAKKTQLRFADREDAEATVAASMELYQRAVIVKVAENPALLEYSLGKHPAKLAEMSRISDPIKLAAALGKLEGTLRVGNRKKPPEPEEVTRGNAAVMSSDKRLEALEKEAARTNDRTKIAAYKADLARRGKQRA